ncbi:hypothetical protein DH2020_044356 [Rehmannia glutinosa]|uniref:F-box associated beta-propeller type 3 domain-containing protein n=1 Tax=Rehmannia glutinosa TaxID=99300 RepID=A0ABR0UIR7_REHGL
MKIKIKVSRTAAEAQSSAQIVASIDDLLTEILLRLPMKTLTRKLDPSGIGIVQSCNGLLLCSNFRARVHNRRYYVYNPTTNKFSTLPKIDEGGGISVRIHGMSLAFDPAKSPHYKVVCVRQLGLDSGQYEYQFEVYSSETGPWRKCGEPFTTEVNFENGVYWNGAIHWVNNGIGDSLYFNTMIKIFG